jgi:Protein of unknown function (DUF2442)
MPLPEYLVTHVDILDGYRLRLTFRDGTVGDIDLSDLPARGGVFAALRDPEQFRSVRVDPQAGTIVWSDDLDIAPETLYERVRASIIRSRHGSVRGRLSA